MAAPPVPYRASSNRQLFTPSFPPPVYYRDTFGLQPTDDAENVKFLNPYQIVEPRGSIGSISREVPSGSEDSLSTKSTVKNTIKIFHPHDPSNGIFYHPLNPMITKNNQQQRQFLNNGYAVIRNSMNDSGQTDDINQSFNVEQIITNQVLICRARLLLWLTLVAFGTATQLLMFSFLCAFFDGCPYYLAVLISLLSILNLALLLYFIRVRHSQIMLRVCCITVMVNVVVLVVLFFWTAYLIYEEDGSEFSSANKEHEQTNANANVDSPSPKPLLSIVDTRNNYIVKTARLAMYTLQLIYTPILAVCDSAILYILCENEHRHLSDGEVSKGYFFSYPTGHQTVLVPIKLKHVRKLEDAKDGVENTSVAVQTTT